LLALELAVLYDIERSNAQIPVLFEGEIERVAKRNRKKKGKEKQKDTKEESSTTSSFSSHILHEEKNMA